MSDRPEPAPELRQDPLTGDWVIVAPGRSRRPQPSREAGAGSTNPQWQPGCPFCPGNEDQTPTVLLRLPETGEPWTVRVVPNLYPAVLDIASQPASPDPLRVSRLATGSHEVVIETPRHDLELPDRRHTDVLLLLEAFQRRLRHLQAQFPNGYVSIFKNRGHAAGTSLTHPHSQVVALDFVPEQVLRRVERSRAHYRSTGQCLACAVIDEERRAGTSLVLEQQGAVVLAPFASATPGETLILPLPHEPSFAGAAPGALAGVAAAMIDISRRYRNAFDDPAYNLVLHAAPNAAVSDPALHWYWQLAPRQAETGGFELSTGVNINPLPPEEAAGLLRE
jgi:UDPglucose--hexose-1-phosphate uridylyltransferase